MTIEQTAEERFWWLVRVAERLGCRAYVADYGPTAWGGRGGCVAGDRIIQVNTGEPLDSLAPAVLAAVEEALGVETGIGAAAARWLSAQLLLMHELGHVMLEHRKGPDLRDRHEAEAIEYAMRAMKALTADITEEEAAEALKKIGQELTREAGALTT